MYDEIWRSKVLVDPQEIAGLELIQKYTDLCNQSTDPALTRQLQRSFMGAKRRAKRKWRRRNSVKQRKEEREGGQNSVVHRVLSGGSNISRRSLGDASADESGPREGGLWQALTGRHGAPWTSRAFSGRVDPRPFEVDTPLQSDRISGTRSGTLDAWGGSVSGSLELVTGRVENEQLSETIEWGPRYFRYVSVRGAVDEDRPVRSIDQIYMAASLASPFLRAYVLKWASCSNGLLKFRRRQEPNMEEGGEEDGAPIATHPARDEGEGGRVEQPRLKETFESWKVACLVTSDGVGQQMSSIAGGLTESISSHPKVDSGVVWSELKSVTRATEKVLRNYEGDVSMLLDICRETIVFESSCDLASCLLALLGDEDVKVLRVKNRLRESYDSSRTAGYRNVSVNLRLVSETTIACGVDTHVCELQLLLLPFAQLKGSQGHKNYIAYRDVRGQ
mmetsp:Transcript_28580/g.71958  ORF Transcript_28580/g.71958 Transcript_28580/m.71958 type:complete len:448 (-) Transcript_28580:264-1607(-)